VKYLLDTHALIWTLADDPALTEEVRRAVLDADNQIFASVASLWELGIKYATGKIGIHPDMVAKGCAESDFGMLDVTASHAIAVANLPLVEGHRDPFDRLLVVQARAEGMILVTNDRKIIDHYGVQTLYCERPAA
jgi:PIN domain nuclease of toxin-antitoxin system